MQYLQNLHTHSTFCDGKNTLEEMVKEALARGFHSIGFSKHSDMPFSSYFKWMPEEAEQNNISYRCEAARLKEVYRDQIAIFCAEEVEMFSKVDKKNYDYLIGSVHYLKIGMFNALVVSSMMGCTISFTIPFALGLVPKEQHKNLLLGLLCGIVTIPVGCFVGGLVCGIAFLPLILNLLSLILLSALIAFGLLKFPGVCVKIFAVLGFAMKALIIVGLVFGMAHFLTGFALFPEIGDAWDEGIRVCTNAAVFLAGAFPLVFVVSRLLHRPLRLLGRALRINETSALCLLSSLASSSATFGMMKSMDERGTVLNAAFAVSGAFVFAGHLAFTVAFDPAYVPAMVVGKLVGGVLALLLAIFISSRTLTTKEETEA